MAGSARKRKVGSKQAKSIFRNKEDVIRGFNKTIEWLKAHGAKEITLEELERSLSKVREPAHKAIRRLRDEEG